jgi:hypothetical protein
MLQETVMAHYEMSVRFNVNLGIAATTRLTRVIEAVAAAIRGGDHVPSTEVISGQELKLCIDTPREIPTVECWRMHAILGNLLNQIVDAEMGEFAYIGRLHRIPGGDVNMKEAS